MFENIHLCFCIFILEGSSWPSGDSQVMVVWRRREAVCTPRL